MDAPLYVLRMEPVTTRDKIKPWVARITGISERFGLRRQFIRPMNDWSDASVSRNGVGRGIVPTFPLRVGWVVEVQRLTKRGHALRSFGTVTTDGIEDMSSREVLAWAAQQQTA